MVVRRGVEAVLKYHSKKDVFVYPGFPRWGGSSTTVFAENYMKMKLDRGEGHLSLNPLKGKHLVIEYLEDISSFFLEPEISLIYL